MRNETLVLAIMRSKVEDAAKVSKEADMKVKMFMRDVIDKHGKFSRTTWEINRSAKYSASIERAKIEKKNKKK